MLPEEDRATAIVNMHKTFGEDRTFNSEDMSHISRTDRRAHHNTPFPCRGGVIMDRWAHASLPVQAASRILDRFIRFATSRQTDTVHTLTQTTCCDAPNEQTSHIAASFVPSRDTMCAVIPRQLQSIISTVTFSATFCDAFYC